MSDEKKQSLWTNGCLAAVRIRFWVGQRTIDPTEVGLDRNRLPDLLTKLCLVPHGYVKGFTCVATKARLAAERFGVAFPAGGTFVPTRNIPRLVRELERFKVEFEGLRGRFLAEYAEIRDRCLAQYQAEIPLLPRLFPSEAELQAKYEFAWYFYEFQVPRRLRIALKDQEDAEKQAEVEAEAARQAEEMVKEFAAVAASEIRTRLLECLNRVAERIRKGGVIGAKQVGAMRLTLDRAEALNILREQGVQSTIEALRTTLDGTANFREDATAVEQLRQTVETATSSLTDVAAAEEAVDVFVRRIEL